MARKIVINKCTECPHFSYSGALTPGGTIPLCNKVHDPITKWRRPPLPYTYDEITGEPTYAGIIPDWCPLPENL